MRWQKYAKLNPITNTASVFIWILGIKIEVRHFDSFFSSPTRRKAHTTIKCDTCTLNSTTPNDCWVFLMCVAAFHIGGVCDENGEMNIEWSAMAIVAHMQTCNISSSTSSSSNGMNNTDRGILLRFIDFYFYFQCTEQQCCDGERWDWMKWRMKKKTSVQQRP